MNAKIKNPEIRLESKGWNYWPLWLLLDWESCQEIDRQWAEKDKEKMKNEKPKFDSQGKPRRSIVATVDLEKGKIFDSQGKEVKRIRSSAELLAIEIMRVKDERE